MMRKILFIFHRFRSPYNYIYLSGRPQLDNERKTSRSKTLFIKLNFQPQGAAIKKGKLKKLQIDISALLCVLFVAYIVVERLEKAGKCLICGQDLNEITVASVLHIHTNVHEARVEKGSHLFRFSA